MSTANLVRFLLPRRTASLVNEYVMTNVGMSTIFPWKQLTV